jgi:CheY-like chemotaxis protein
MGRIALIDDSKDALEVFEIILRGNHEIATFSDPAAFLGQFQSRTFDLILLDLAMPDIDGFEVFQKIRQKDSDVPVVAVTAVAHPEQREKALKAGFCDYFVKPILQIEQFRQAVHSHVGRCANPPYKECA